MFPIYVLFVKLCKDRGRQQGRKVSLATRFERLSLGQR
jgi:hypothetical protein